MIKRVLIAAALVIASPALVSAQSLFLSFASDASVDSVPVSPVGAVGTVYLFSDGAFGFDAADLNITSSDPSVLQITGGTTFNDAFSVIGGNTFDSSVLTVATDGSSANLFSVNVTQNGINPAVSALFNPAWEAGAGSAGAVRLASVDYSIAASGNARLGLSVGAQGVLQLPLNDLTDIVSAEFASSAAENGSVTFGTPDAVPEPSSLALLVLGSVGLVARRKRS